MLKGPIMKKLLSKKGSITVLTALLLPIMLAFTGFAVDVGRLYVEKAKLQNLADAAALAGFTQLKLDTSEANDFVLQGNLIPNMPIGAITDISTRFKTIDENNKIVECKPLDLANNGANRYLSLNSGDLYSTSSSSVQTRLYHTANSQVEDSFYYEIIISADYPLYFAKIVYPEDSMQVRAGALVKFDRVEKEFDPATYIGFLRKYGRYTRRQLVDLPSSWSKYYSYGWNATHFNPEDMHDNADFPNYKRLEADKSALNNIADIFIGMSYDDLKSKVFVGRNDNDFKKGKDIILLNYHDHARVEENYNEATGEYSNPVFEKTENGKKYTPSIYTEVSVGSNNYGYTKDDVIHWMQGDYGNYKETLTDSNTKLNYTYSDGYQQGVRYLFSNDVIVPYQEKNTSTPINIKVSFNIEDDASTGTKVVKGVKVKLQKYGKDITDANVVKGFY